MLLNKLITVHDRGEELQVLLTALHPMAETTAGEVMILRDAGYKGHFLTVMSTLLNGGDMTTFQDPHAFLRQAEVDLFPVCAVR